MLCTFAVVSLFSLCLPSADSYGISHLNETLMMMILCGKGRCLMCVMTSQSFPFAEARQTRTRTLNLTKIYHELSQTRRHCRTTIFSCKHQRLTQRAKESANSKTMSWNELERSKKTRKFTNFWVAEFLCLQNFEPFFSRSFAICQSCSTAGKSGG